MNIAGLKTGDVKEAFTVDLAKNLEQIVNAKSHLRQPYFILVYMKEGYSGDLALGNNNYLLHGEDERRVRTTGDTVDMDLSGKKISHTIIQIMFKKDVPKIPLIGTALFKVTNKTGEVKMCYALPPDRPMVPSFNIEPESETVGVSAIGMPIVYGAEN